MNNGLKQLQSNRIRMRANEFVFYYMTMKELVQTQWGNRVSHLCLWCRSHERVRSLHGHVEPKNTIWSAPLGTAGMAHQ